MNTSNYNIIVIGLGYVGLRLALEMSKVFPTLGFDNDPKRLNSLVKGIDNNGDIAIPKEHTIQFVSEIPKIDASCIFIITVPTLIDQHKKPDLSHLIDASQSVGKALKKGDVVVYESTTYPGCTRDICVPVLEETSGLVTNKDFGVAYCPERISPGKTVRPWNEIVRVLGASNSQTLERTAKTYEKTQVKAIYKVATIEEAEMAKLVENTQRDVNISFVNEVALLCDQLGLSTQNVLKAAGTKWNFHQYQPGLVGGHCISVDPYYLIHAAEQVTFFPKLIGAGREVNESLVRFIATKCIKLLVQKGNRLHQCKGLILGATYKENCADVRNSKAAELAVELSEYGIDMTIYDPFINTQNQKNSVDLNVFDLIVLAVPHDEFLRLDFTSRKLNSVLFDVKWVLGEEIVDGCL